MRVAVTGMGVWCSVGRTLDQFGEALRSGRSGRRPVTRIDVSHRVYRTREAAVLADEDEIPRAVDDTRMADLSLVVARQALDDAGLVDADLEDAGLTLGTSHGGNIALMRFVRSRLALNDEAMDPGLLLQSTPTVAGQVAR